jgi:hypothetical protein
VNEFTRQSNEWMITHPVIGLILCVISAFIFVQLLMVSLIFFATRSFDRIINEYVHDEDDIDENDEEEIGIL